jgi:hypothetical protein
LRVGKKQQLNSAFGGPGFSPAAGIDFQPGLQPLKLQGLKPREDAKRMAELKLGPPQARN